MHTTPTCRLATLSLATLVGILAATGMTFVAAGQAAPVHTTATDGVTDSGCQTPDAAPAGGTAGLWFGPTMYAAW